MSKKYSFSDACTKRLVAELKKELQESGSLMLIDVIKALHKEQVYNPRENIDDFLTALRAQDEHHLIFMIALDCAREAAQLHKKLRDIKDALGTLGVMFRDDIKPEARTE